MLNKYWLNTPWLYKLKLIIKVLNKYDINLINVNDIIKITHILKISLIRNRNIIELYMLDMYCLNSFDKPAFCLDINEINYKKSIDVYKNIKQAALHQIDLLTAFLYGDTYGKQQVDYLVKWCNINILIMTHIWNTYELKENHSLINAENDILKIRHLYLRKLDIINNKNTELSTNNSVKILNSLLN